MIYRFGRAVPQLSMIFNQIFDIVDTHFGRLLQGNNQPWLNPNYLQHIAHTIYRKGILDNIWGFINPFQDGPFWGCLWVGGGTKRPPFLKICFAYPTVMKLGTAIPLPKEDPTNIRIK